jgi:peptide-N4-(N-acetyl-beta-glucosaminyl)asparagine amidase
MAYCIAFSIDGATDVTRRYVRSSAKALDRTRAPEEVTRWITEEITRKRRERLSPEARQTLKQEDEREERELQSYVVQAIAVDVTSMLPEGPPPAASNETTRPSAESDDHKLPVVEGTGRQSGECSAILADLSDVWIALLTDASGSPEWIRARGEGGQGPPGADH